MALLSVAAATAQQTAPPAYTGTGIEWQLKKGKYYLKSVLPHSPADGKIPATAMKKTWLASVKNETTGKSYAVGGGEQDLLAAVTGPEQSVCRMELVLPGKKGRITVAVPLGLYLNPTDGKEYAICTGNEKQYIAARFPYNYVQDERPPNRDNDSLPDSRDKCPEQWGWVATGGCPTDRDRDGVFDHADRCPDVPGMKAKKGCPDKDADEDGILDENDECPFIPGWTPGDGCDNIADSLLYKDADGDGTPDAADVCPDMWGPIHYKGCPNNNKTDLPKAFWTSLLHLLVTQSQNNAGDALQGKLIETTEDSSQWYILKLPMAGIATNNAKYVKESSGTVRFAIDFGYTESYRVALNYFTSLATEMNYLIYKDSMYGAELAVEEDQLMYVPDMPLLQFTPFAEPDEDLEAEVDIDDDLLYDINNYYILQLGVYEFAKSDGTPYYAVRMWVN